MIRARCQNTPLSQPSRPRASTCARARRLSGGGTILCRTRRRVGRGSILCCTHRRVGRGYNPVLHASTCREGVQSCVARVDVSGGGTILCCTHRRVGRGYNHEKCHTEASRTLRRVRQVSVSSRARAWGAASRTLRRVRQVSVSSRARAWAKIRKVSHKFGAPARAATCTASVGRLRANP